MFFFINPIFTVALRRSILRCRAMNPILLHPLILADMLRPERMIFAEDHTHAERQHRPCHKPYRYSYFYQRTHARIQIRLQRYTKKLTYTRVYAIF